MIEIMHIHDEVSGKHKEGNEKYPVSRKDNCQHSDISLSGNI